MLENFKRKLQERIEKNAVKIPQISYKDKEGTYTEDIILKRSTFPSQFPAVANLVGDWSRVYPPVEELNEIDPKTGRIKIKVLWINVLFGGKKNLIKLLIVLGIVAMILLAFSQVFSDYEALKRVCIQIVP